jgi:ABC-type nickel/cobalt efflux system permease component RcnA
MADIAKAALEDGGAGTLFVILAAIALTKLAEFISAKRRSSSEDQHYRGTPEHHNHQHRHSDENRMHPSIHRTVPRQRFPVPPSTMGRWAA